MDSRLHFVVNILTVLFIHEVVFSKCELITKTYNHVTKSYVDGFHRKERQAPIDPSRMYLPPRIDSVASSGFGGQIDVSNNFGGNNNGYGEVQNVQDTFAKSPTADFSNYGPSPKTTDGAGGVQTTLGSYDTSTRTSDGPVGSSLDQSNGYNTLPTGGNNFRQLLNKNSDYNSAVSLPETNNNYSNSLGTTSVPNKNSVTAQTGTADGYGQNELLNTAQNQGLTRYNYNGATSPSQFGQNPSTSGDQYSQQGTVENTADGYGNIDLITSKASLQDNNRIGGQNAYDGQGSNRNYGLNRGQPFSVDNSDYGNTLPNSYGQKYTSGEYTGNGNRPNTQFSVEKSIDISNNPSSIGSAGYPSSVPNFRTQDNPISKSTSQSNNDIINGNYGQTEFSNSRGFQAGGYNQESLSSGYGQYPSELNKGITATTQSYGQNEFKKQNTDSYSSNSKDVPYSGESLPITNGFEQSPAIVNNQKLTGINKNQIGGTSTIGSQSLNSIGTSNGVQSTGITDQNVQSLPGVQNFNQGQSSSNYYENGFDLNPLSRTRGSNNFGQSGSHSISVNEENYGQISPAYNGFNQDQQNQQLSNNYLPPPRSSQSYIDGRNPVPSQSKGSQNDGYNQGRPLNSPNGFDQSRPTTPQASNNYNNTEYQLPSLSENGFGQGGSVPLSSGGFYQGNPSNELNGFGQNTQSTPQRGRPNNYGPAASQILSTTINSFSQNSPTSGDYSQEAPEGSKPYEENSVKSNSLNRENIATTQLGGYNSQNSFSTQSLGQESSSLLPSYGQGNGPCTSKNGGDVSQGKTSTVSPADPGYAIRNQKKYSTLVPKGQFQNSNLPNSEKGVFTNANNGNNYGEPGLNSFSNFAPGNQPNQPINPGTNNCDTSKRGEGINEAVFSPLNTGY